MNGLANWRARNFVALGMAVWMLGSIASAAPLALSNGVAVNGLAGTLGSETFYTIEVPAGQDDLEIQITGGSGDCDLYVKRGAPPTLTNYDYRPYQVGSEETVTVATPAAGTWYIMLRGYTAYSGLTLVATYSASVTVTNLTNGVPLAGLSAPTGTETFYKLEVPAGQTKLEIQISGGSGDCDLYVKRGALPTTAIYDYRPYVVGNNEKVTVDNPVAGTWYIMLRAYHAYSGLTLQATYSGGLGIALTNGVPVTNLSGALASEKLYRIEVPAGQSNLEIKISGGTGDVDLYVKFANPPTTSEFDYRPFTPGNEETVTVNTPTAGTWYIMLRGYTAYSGLTLVGTYGGLFTLENGVPVTDLSGPTGSEKLFKIDVLNGETEFEIRLSGGTGNADLYVRRGLRPTVSEWDYRPYLPGNNETVSLSNPQGGIWYILVRARQAYAGVTLVAEHAFVGNVTMLSNGVPVTNTAGPEGSKKYYRIIVPSDEDEFEIQISGGTGDADLYVNHGDAVPTLTDYDYRPYQIGNNETVTIADPPSGNWLIMVHAYHAYTGLTVVATYSSDGGGGGDPTVTPLSNGVPVTGLSGATGGQVFYKIDVPAGQSNLKIQMSGGSGDADMYIRKDQRPTLTEWDYRPFLIGNNETVTIETPAAGTYFILLNAFQAYSGVTLVASYEPIPDPVTELSNGVPVTGLSGAVGSETFYKIVVPAGQDVLDIQMAGGSGDADLYVKKGSQPTATSWDYRPFLIGNNETVHIEPPAAATWYVMIKAYQAYTGVSLVATYGVTVVGNNFAVDPNCVALWRFEPDKLTADSIGTNTLSIVDNPLANQTEVQEGLASVDTTNGYFFINDPNLDADFPLKSTVAKKDFSVAFWMKVPSGMGVSSTNGDIVYGKGGANGKYSLNIGVREPFGLGSGQVIVNIGEPGGFGHAAIPVPEAVIQRDRWYHVAVAYDDDPGMALGHVRIRIYDATAASITEKLATTPSINVSDGRVTIGAYRYADHRYHGFIDELVVFKDVLTAAEIDKIRQATYGK